MGGSYELHALGQLDGHSRVVDAGGRGRLRCAILMMEVMKDNGRPEAGAIYGAIDMDWAKLVGQLAQAYGK